MTKVVIDADGNEITAYTEEELNAQIEKLKTEALEKEKALSQELEALKAEKEKLADKDKNWKGLRDKADNLEEQKKEIADLAMSEIEKLRKEVNENRLNDAISEIAGNDKDLSDKIKYYYNTFKEPSAGEEDKRLENAILMAGGKNSGANNNASLFGTGNGRAPIAKGSDFVPNGKLSQEALEVARKFSPYGMTEEVLKKFGKI